jgi:hypothetical protein
MATITRYGHPKEVLPLGEAMDRLFREAFTRPRFFAEGYRPPMGFGQTIWVGMAEGAFREVAAEQAGATYYDGIVTLVLPKAEQAKVKTIKIGAVQPLAGEGAKT